MSFRALAAAANLRDLGGRASGDGRSVRRRALYRSGELSTLGYASKRALARLGLRTVIDLRTDEEVRRRGATPRFAGMRIVRIPMDSGDLTSGILPLVLRGRFDEVPLDLLAQVNRRLVRDAAASLRAVFDVLLEPGAAPLLVHCTHGKDRTGLVSALVLSALGVGWGAVVDDYLHSNVTRTTQHRLQRMAVRTLSPFLAGRPFVRHDLRPVDRLFDVVPENLEAAREEVDRIAGGFDGYLEGPCGLGPVRRASLRSLWLEDPRAG